MAATSAKRAPRNFWGVERLKTADLLNGFAEFQRSRAPAPGRDSSTTLSMRERSIFANVVFKKHGLRACSTRRGLQCRAVGSRWTNLSTLANRQIFLSISAAHRRHDENLSGHRGLMHGADEIEKAFLVKCEDVRRFSEGRQQLFHHDGPMRVHQHEVVVIVRLQIPELDERWLVATHDDGGGSN